MTCSNHRHLLILSLISLISLSAGCADFGRLDLSDYGSSTLDPGRFRPDFLPLGDQPQSGDRATYSDGTEYGGRGEEDEEGTLPLSPIIFKDIDGPLNNQLRRAECLWIDQGNETARLSHEYILNDFALGDTGRVVEQMSTCTGVGNDPDTRGPFSAYLPPDMKLTEQDMLQQVTKIREFFDIRVTMRKGSAVQDPHHGCDAGDSRIPSLPTEEVFMSNRTTEESVFVQRFADRGDTPLLFPMCLNQGSFVPISEDVSLEMNAFDIAAGMTLTELGENAIPFELPTRLKVVEASSVGDEFLISRPLEYLGARVPRGDGDRTVTPFGWTWNAGFAADGIRWRENFSPNLAISRIRFFRILGIDPDSGELIREYLAPDHLDAYTDRVFLREKRALDCDITPGVGEMPAACDKAVGLTPTFKISDDGNGPVLTDQLTWVVEFDEVVRCEIVPPADENCPEANKIIEKTPPVDPTEKDLYIEFLVERPVYGTNQSGLLIGPAQLNLGDVAGEEGKVVPEAFSIENVATGNLRIRDVYLDGDDAADFKIQGDTGVGQVLNFGERIDLDLRVRPHSLHAGRRSAQLRVIAEDGSGATSSVHAEVRAEITAWDLLVVHNPFAFFLDSAIDRERPGTDPRGFQKVLLLLNVGTASLPRDQFTLTGPGAEFFSVVRWESEYLDSADYMPWRDGEEPDFSASIEPGDSENLFVIYHPNDAQPRPAVHPPIDEAELRIQVGEAEYVVPLRGTCGGSCLFDGPQPVGPPSAGSGAVETHSGAYVAPMGSLGLLEPESELMNGN